MGGGYGNARVWMVKETTMDFRLFTYLLLYVLCTECVKTTIYPHIGC